MPDARKRTYTHYSFTFVLEAIKLSYTKLKLCLISAQFTDEKPNNWTLN